jgi:hypothetical protein
MVVRVVGVYVMDVKPVHYPLAQPLRRSVRVR